MEMQKYTEDDVSNILEGVRENIQKGRCSDAADSIQDLLRFSSGYENNIIPVAIDLIKKLSSQKRSAWRLEYVFEKAMKHAGDYQDELVNLGLELVRNGRGQESHSVHWNNAVQISEDLIRHFIKDYESGVPVIIKNPELFAGIEKYTSIVAEWVEKWAFEQPESRAFKNGFLCQNFAVCKDPFFMPQNSGKISIVKEYPRHAILIKEGRKQPVIYTGRFEGTLFQFNKACSAYPYGSDNDFTRRSNIKNMVEKLNKSCQIKRTP